MSVLEKRRVQFFLVVPLCPKKREKISESYYENLFSLQCNVSVNNTVSNKLLDRYGLFSFFRIFLIK